MNLSKIFKYHIMDELKVKPDDYIWFDNQWVHVTEISLNSDGFVELSYDDEDNQPRFALISSDDFNPPVYK